MRQAPGCTLLHCRSRCRNTPKGVLNRLQRNLAGLAADFNGRLRDRSNHDAVIARARSLSNFLNKGDEVVIRASGQAGNAVEFLCMQLEFKRQEQEKRRYRIALVQSWLALGVSIASLIVAIIALMR